MAILITLFTTIISMYNAFISTDNNKIILLKSFNASKLQIFFKLILMENLNSLISTLKINIGLSLIGVIMGEFLVSKEGIGYSAIEKLGLSPIDFQNQLMTMFADNELKINGICGTWGGGNKIKLVI